MKQKRKLVSLINNSYAKISLIICGSLIFLNGCGLDCNSSLNRTIKPLIINGIVIKKAKSSTGCFGEIIIEKNDKFDTLKNICYCVPSNESVWDYVLPNDSLFKAKGSLIISVSRNGKNKQDFNYPCCRR